MKSDSEENKYPPSEKRTAKDLPTIAVPARLVVLCFTITFLIYFAFIPHFVKYASPPTGDQPFYLMDAISLAQDGDLNVANNYQDHDYDKFYSLAPRPPDFVGMDAPYPLPEQLAISSARPPEEEYGFHPPGLGFWLVPVWLIGGLFALWWPATIVFMCAIGALVCTNVALFAYEVVGGTRTGIGIAGAVWATMTFSAPIMPYSYLIFSELPAGLLLIYAFRRLSFGWGANGPWRILAVGTCIAYLPWLATRYLPIAAGLGLYALVQWWLSATREKGEITPNTQATESGGDRWQVKEKLRVLLAPGHWQRFALFLAPIVVLAILMVGYNLFLYGGLIPPSDERGGGGVGGFHWPWVDIHELTRFTMGVFGQLYSQRYGLLTYAPVYMLSLVGLVAMWRTGPSWARRMVVAGAAVVAPYYMFISAYDAWGGDWGPPARYPLTLIVLCAAPLAYSLFLLGKYLIYKFIYWIFAAMGFICMSVMLYDPRTMFSDAQSAVFTFFAEAPVLPVHFDLRPFMPRSSYWNDSPDWALHPIRSGWVLSVTILILVFCIGLLYQRQRKATGATSMFSQLVWSGGLVGVIGLVWFSSNVEFLQPQTNLQYVNSWDLDTPVYSMGGIEYLDNKLYIPEYGERTDVGFNQGWVGVFDVQAAQYTHLKAVDPAQGGVVVPWAHPGDAKVGPDGYLYVLNNGRGQDALWALDLQDSTGGSSVISPTARIVRKIALQQKSELGKGLQIDAQGDFYVADQVSGIIFKYGPDGGEPLQRWSGEDGILNNPRSLGIGPDGSIYTGESYKRIQYLSVNNALLKQYTLWCRPRYFAQSSDGEWLDVTCSTGMFSIDTVNGSMQLAQVDGGPLVTAPTGVAHGPGDTLYLMEDNRILEYVVAR